MRDVFLAALVTISFLAAPESTPADEFPLQYGYVRKPSPDGIHGAGATMEILFSAPAGVTLPKSAGSDPVFCKWKTVMGKEGFVLVAFARSGRDPWRDRIVVDTNCDGRLADETPIEPFLTQGRMDYSHYGPVEVKLPGPEGGQSYHATFSLYAGVPSQRTAWVKPSCWHEGTLTIDGATYAVDIVDANANGVCDDISMNPDNADIVAFPSADGCEHRSIGKYICIAGKLFCMKVARDGSCIDLVPAENVATGKIRTKGHVTNLVLAGENGQLSLDLAENRADVPAGKWMVKEWVFDGNLSEGRAPAFGDYRFGTETTVVVAEGKEVELDVGAPTDVHADLSKASNLNAYPGGIAADASAGTRRYAGGSARSGAVGGARPSGGSSGSGGGGG